MNVSYNPIQYQLQLFGVNAVQIGANPTPPDSDLFDMAVKTVGASNGQSANGSDSGGADSRSYRDWVRHTRAYNAAATAGPQPSAESPGDRGASGDAGSTGAAQITGEGEIATDPSGSTSGANAARGSGATDGGATGPGGANGSAGSGSPGGSGGSGGNDGGGLFGWLLR